MTKISEDFSVEWLFRCMPKLGKLNRKYCTGLFSFSSKRKSYSRYLICWNVLRILCHAVLKFYRIRSSYNFLIAKSSILLTITIKGIRLSVHVMVSFKDERHTVYQELILTPLDTVLTGTVTICNYNDILWSEGRRYNLASLSITLVSKMQL